jgi:glycosyltransferase family protein
MKNFFRKIIQTIRQHTPLWLRWKFGPIVAYVAYFFRIYIFGNKNAPKVLSIEDTLDLIEKQNLSFVRFGDGEITLIQKNDLLFQKSDPELVRRLREILNSNLPGLLICLPDLFGKLDGFAKDAYKFALHHQFRYWHEWTELLNLSQTYGNTFITRPYLGFTKTARQKSGNAFKKLFNLWKGKHVLLVEGSKSRLGVGNNMFSQAASVTRILCPAENAYAKYKEILAEVLKNSKEKFVLLSLGPAAKVLGYDLFIKGYRVLDIGHLDMEYEMFLRQAEILAKVKYKYFNEINERTPEDCVDPKYLSEIISRIE